MLSQEVVKELLLEAKRQEKIAEENAEKILREAELNGFKHFVEKIKNDEVKHQRIVDQLLEYLK